MEANNQFVSLEAFGLVDDYMAICDEVQPLVLQVKEPGGRTDGLSSLHHGNECDNQ